jgi:hypothetical protein
MAGHAQSASPDIAQGQSDDTLLPLKSNPTLAAEMTGAYAALLAQYHIDTAENPFPILKDAIGNDAAGRRSNMLMGKMGFGGPDTAASPAAAAVPSAAGSIARKIVELPMHRAVAALDSLVRANSPLAAHVAAQLHQQIVQQLGPLPLNFARDDPKMMAP